MHTKFAAALALLPLAVYAQDAAIIQSSSSTTTTTATTTTTSGAMGGMGASSTSSSTTLNGTTSGSSDTSLTTSTSLMTTTTSAVPANPPAVTGGPLIAEVKVYSVSGSESLQYWANGTSDAGGASKFSSKYLHNQTRTDETVTSTSTKTVGTTSRTTTTTSGASGTATQRPASDASKNANFLALGTMLGAAVVAVGLGALL